MTNWTDLIDTDPVAAYHEYAKCKNIGMAYSTSNLWKEERERLMSNLAALCEELSESVAEQTKDEMVMRSGTFNAAVTAQWIREKTMRVMRNSDGTPRFPKVK